MAQHFHGWQNESLGAGVPTERRAAWRPTRGAACPRGLQPSQRVWRAHAEGHGSPGAQVLDSVTQSSLNGIWGASSRCWGAAKLELAVCMLGTASGGGLSGAPRNGGLPGCDGAGLGAKPRSATAVASPKIPEGNTESERLLNLGSARRASPTGGCGAVGPHIRVGRWSACAAVSPSLSCSSS